jgi:hypothetical protein
MVGGKSRDNFGRRMQQCGCQLDESIITRDGSAWILFIVLKIAGNSPFEEPGALIYGEQDVSPIGSQLMERAWFLCPIHLATAKKVSRKVIQSMISRLFRLLHQTIRTMESLLRSSSENCRTECCLD